MQILQGFPECCKKEGLDEVQVPSDICDEEEE